MSSSGKIGRSGHQLITKNGGVRHQNYEFSSSSSSKGPRKTISTAATITQKNLHKVSVAFGSISVVVPVSQGMLVADLIEAAVLRYKRAMLTGYTNNNDKRIYVKYLRSAIGGILYNGDELEKVVDDGEQIVAVYDVQETTAPPGGISTSVSSEKNTVKVSQNSKINQIYDFPAGTSAEKRLSHEIETRENICSIRIKKSHAKTGVENRLSVGDLTNNKKDSINNCSVLINNPNDIPVSSGILVVRRGSEPALNGPDDVVTVADTGGEAKMPKSFKTSTSPRQRVRWNNGYSKKVDENEPNHFNTAPSGVSRFVRNATRKSQVTEEMLETAALLAESCSRQESQHDVNQKEFDDRSPERKRPTTLKMDNAPAIPSKESAMSGSASGTNAPLQMSNLQKANTRKMGKLLTVDLLKDFDGKGLGFTVTTRDNVTIGGGFVCIKNILPLGPAVKDGRLKEGDRILKINGVDVTEFSKDKIVATLRSARVGETVNLVVSRHIDASQPVASSSVTLPRHIPHEKTELTILDAGNSKQHLVLNIPLNDSGSAGLGVSVKGRIRATTDLSASSLNNSSSSSQSINDCGIFIKLIIHGGAAFKHGRLKVNDQLIAVNNVNLLGLSNKDAMNAVRRAMQSLSPSAKSIQLTVLRNLPASFDIGGDSSSKVLPSPNTPDGSASLLLETPRLTTTADKMVYSTNYDDYAVIVKKDSINNAPTLTQGSLSDEHFYVEHDAETAHLHASVVNNVPASKSESAIHEEFSVYQNLTVEPFVRDSRSRQSMSEKRHGVSKLDPSQMTTYQQIVHQRQSSAPSLAGSKNTTTTKTAEIRTTKDTAISNEYSKRRTLSLESLNTGQQPGTCTATPSAEQSRFAPPLLLHEQIVRNLAHNVHPSANQNKSKFKVRSVTPQRVLHEIYDRCGKRVVASNDLHLAIMADSLHDQNILNSPTENPSAAASGSSGSFQANNTSTAKEKTRRKSSTGGLSTLKNLFRLGSGGKSFKKLGITTSTAANSCPKSETHSSPKESMDVSRRRAEEEQKRIKMYYERFKMQNNANPAGGYHISPVMTHSMPSQFLVPDKSHCRVAIPPPDYRNAATGPWPNNAIYRPPSPPIVLFSSLSSAVPSTNARTQNYYWHENYNEPIKNFVETGYCQSVPCRPDYLYREADYANCENERLGDPLRPTRNFDCYPRVENIGPRTQSFGVPVRPVYHGAQRSEPAVTIHCRSVRNPIVDNNRMPLIPPPDYEEYLRSVNSSNYSKSTGRRYRPSSEFIETTTNRFEEPRKGPITVHHHLGSDYHQHPGQHPPVLNQHVVVYDEHHYNSLPRNEGNYSHIATRIRM